ncbi:MAG: histidinol dehydrogenase, partial [Vulcanimicrobiaceae bacterium]
MSSIRVLEAQDSAAWDAFTASGWNPEDDVVTSVGRIVADVRKRGDDALVEYARKFDDPAFTRDRLRVELPSAEKARSLVPSDVAAGLELARDRVRSFHERQRTADVEYDERDGTRYAMMTRPLASIGAYVPGGTASLPSSVVMTVVPAKVAGVARVAVATPPSREGSVNPAILFACALCGADQVYAVGGAQAIAALAYGTQTIGAVDKIVGPGNVWVTEAKRQVFGKVGIDGLAGPSEVLVVADDQARPEFVAGEMLAQAEHDPRSRVAAVSTSRALLDEVARLLDGARASGDRGDIVERVLDNATWLIHARSEDEMLEIAERFAPEHLSVQTREP